MTILLFSIWFSFRLQSGELPVISIRLYCVILAVGFLVACGKSKPDVSQQANEPSTTRPAAPATVLQPARPFAIADGLLTDPAL